MWSRATLLLLTATAGQVLGCDYSQGSVVGDGYCIGPKITASTNFSWPPLFPGQAKFVYAVDDYTVDGAVSSVVAFWLEYDKVSLDNNDLEMVTEMVTLYTNVSVTTGGGSNGCESLLGKSCIDQIANKVQNLWSTLPEFQFALRSLNNNTENITACPPDLFSDIDLMNPRVNASKISDLFVATEAPPNASPMDPINWDSVTPSGNASFTYSRQIHPERSIEQQEQKAAVALMMRYPVKDSQTNPPTTTKDVSVNFVCAKPSGVAGGLENAAGLVEMPIKRLAVAGVIAAMLAGPGLW